MSGPFRIGDDPDRLPPYGFMMQDFQRAVADHPRPHDWSAAGESWKDWFERLTTVIRDNIWPVYDAKQGWTGPQRDNILDLTRLELVDMGKITERFLRVPVWDSGSPDDTHQKLFLLEDDKAFDSTLMVYAPELKGQAKQIEELVSTGCWKKAYMTAICFKARFQRPRAKQVAMLFDPSATPHHWEWAKTAYTPSMISSHGLHSLMAGCTVFEGLEVSGNTVTALKQWTVDIGDRRVIAGVHYPMDSLASWVVALDMVERVFPGGSVKSVRRFLAEAIVENSHLYAYMKARIDYHRSHGGGEFPYTSAWRCLEASLGEALSET